MLLWIRDQLFTANPLLYIILIVVIVGCVFRYVWKHEAAQARARRLDNYRPFK